MKTSAVIFPFDLFGSGGAGAGAELLGDALREMLADNRRERVPTRALAYQGQVRVSEWTFETLADYQDWRRQGRRAVRKAWERGDFLLWLTGNHLGALPVYDELAGSGDETLVVQFDAHLDVYNLTDCTEELSHGNFLMHCAGPLPPIVNVGHRDLLLRPEHVGKYYRNTVAADVLACNLDGVVAQLRTASSAAKRIVIDLDCDVFDPAFFPATSHPLPLGFGPAVLLRLLDAVWSGRVAGVVVSEFVPARDRNDQSLATLVWLLEYVLLRRYEAE